MGNHYDTDEELARAGRFRELQRQRTERDLKRRNRKRQVSEAQRFANPLSGMPQKRKGKKKSRGQLARELFLMRERAIWAEAELGRKKPTDFYDSPEWRTLRYQALKASNGKCQLCGSTGQLHVDHIKPRSKHPELALRLDNLQVLCKDCNLGKGAWDATDWRKGNLKNVPVNG